MSNLIKPEDWKIIAGAAIVFVLSIFSLYVTISYFSIIAAWLSIIVVDLYFMFVILYAARKSDEYKPDEWKWSSWVPNKFSGVIVFAFLYFSAIISFAKMFMYAEAPDYSDSQLSLYKSLISITSFSYDDYKLKSCGLQWLQMFQSFNGILLLTTTFGFLISRISSFKEEINLTNIKSEIQNMKLAEREIDAILSVKKLIEQNEALLSENKGLKSKITELEKK